MAWLFDGREKPSPRARALGNGAAHVVNKDVERIRGFMRWEFKPTEGLTPSTKHQPLNGEAA
jgi:hypothetical protein